MTAGRLLAVVGPTAAGKSALALGLARRLGGEIVSADSMQVYRRLDIGTAKPSTAERAAAPHHLIDLVDPQAPFSVAAYQRLARETIGDLQARGRLPLLVGGTGLYVRAVLYDYDFTPPGRDDQVRRELAEQAERDGPPALWRRLAEIDPAAAARIHRNDTRRIIRALEVYTLTGQPISKGWREPSPRYDHLIIGLRLPRAELAARIDDRVVAMVGRGLVGEVRRLVDQGYTRALVSGQALGYKEIVAHLAGETSLDEAVARIQTATRQYAKRQMTWFRREPGVVWLEGPGRTSGPLVDQVVGLARAKWANSL